MNNPPVTPRILGRAVPTTSAVDTAEAASPAGSWATGVVAARLRRGVELPNGRIVGETDRDVHLIQVPATETMPEHLSALCGLRIRPGDAEQVAVGTGMPCVPCICAVPKPEDAAISSAARPR